MAIFTIFSKDFNFRVLKGEGVVKPNLSENVSFS